MPQHCIDVLKYFSLEACLPCSPPAVETTNAIPDKCPICADWDTEPFGTVKLLFCKVILMQKQVSNYQKEKVMYIARYLMSGVL